jgi:MFS family permease
VTAAGPRRRERALRAGREALAVLTAAGVAGVVFLLIVQEAYIKGWTEHQFNAAMGVAVGAGGPDEIKHEGFLATMLVFLVLALAFALLRPAMPRAWWGRGLLAGAVMLAGWGLLLGPYVQGRSDIPSGAFAHEASWQTVPLFVVACAVAGLVLARVHDLVRDAAWWEPKHLDLRESLDSLFTEEVDRGAGPPAGDAPAEGRRARGAG